MILGWRSRVPGTGCNKIQVWWNCDFLDHLLGGSPHSTFLEIIMFKEKTLLIVGGTGSFGNAVLQRFLKTDIKQIRIFSRDEKKQDDMRKLYHNDKLKFYIGNVRDIASVKNSIHGVDYIFHAAALKQVPSCEFFPMEAVKTNIIGTDDCGTGNLFQKSPYFPGEWSSKSYVSKGIKRECVKLPNLLNPVSIPQKHTFLVEV